MKRATIYVTSRTSRSNALTLAYARSARTTGTRRAPTLAKLDALARQTQAILTLMFPHRGHAIARVMHLEREPAECRHLLHKIAQAYAHVLEDFRQEGSKTRLDVRATMRCRNELECCLRHESVFDLPDGLDDFAGGFITDDWHDAR